MQQQAQKHGKKHGGRGGGKDAGPSTAACPVLSATLLPVGDAAIALGLQPFTLTLGCDVCLSEGFILRAAAAAHPAGESSSLDAPGSAPSEADHPPAKRSRPDPSREGQCPPTSSLEAQQPQGSGSGGIAAGPESSGGEEGCIMDAVFKCMRAVAGSETALRGRVVVLGSFEAQLLWRPAGAALAEGSGLQSEEGGRKWWILTCRWQSHDEHIASACLSSLEEENVKV